MPDASDSLYDDVFDVPDIEHPVHTPGNSVKKHEFVLGAPKGALEVQKEKNPYEENQEDEAKKDDEKDKDKCKDNDEDKEKIK